VPWALVSALLVRVVVIWERLPASLVIHFSAAGEPNGWMSRSGFLAFAAAFLLVELSVFSWLVHRLREDRLVAGALMTLFYIFSAGEVNLFWQILEHNLRRTPIRWVEIGVVAALSGLIPAAAVMLAGMSAGRVPLKSAPAIRWPGRRAAGAPTLALEIHRSRRRFWLNLPFCLGLVVGWLASPNLFWKGIVVALALGIGAVMWLVWAGFRYRFTPAGVEILGPWGRLAFIPVDEIEGYEAATVRPLRDLGGWGIRGSRRHRAYIWDGNRVLRICRRDGEVLLGHESPERLALHLDRMKAEST
jgi:hypothetical protein